MFIVLSPSRETSTALCCCLWCCYVVVVVDDDDDDDVDVALFASLTILHYFPNKLEFDQHFDDKMKDLFNKYVLQSFVFQVLEIISHFFIIGPTVWWWKGIMSPNITWGRKVD